MPDIGASRRRRASRSAARGIEVAEIADAWLAPDHRYFKLRGNNGACYILRHDVAGHWQLTLYDLTGSLS